MTGYLIVMAMLVVALIAVLLAFLLDHDEVAPPIDQHKPDARESESAEIAVTAAPSVEDEGTNNDGSTSV